MWHLWRSSGDDPAWQSAVEEACLRDSRDSFFFLWTSSPSVHIGKNQNLWAEVSARECFAGGVTTHRRLSGGGTVYHDPGNLNFSILSNGEPALSFRHYLGWILPFFHKHGISASLREKSDLVIGEWKFSGNAEYFSRGRVLHHGTLLFDSDLGRMRSVLTPRSRHYEDRAVASNPSQTGNLKPHFPAYDSIHAFAEAFLQFLVDELPASRRRNAPPPGIRDAAQNYIEKFRSLEWVVGNAPPYEMSRKIASSGYIWRLRLRTKHGRIEELALSTPNGADSALQSACVGELHHPDILFPILESRRKQTASPFPEKDAWWDLFF